MKFLLLIPSLLIFLFCLYKMMKDDYIFIRKNISLEQVFDIGFSVIIISLLVARLFYFFFNPLPEGNIVLLFLTFNKAGFSFFGGVIGGLIGLYLIGKYRKVPVGRLFDFFTLSLLIALPAGFLSQLVYLRKFDMLIAGINALLYLILTIYFLKYLYPKVLNRTIREGNLSILFLVFFSVASLLSSIIRPVKDLAELVSLQNIMLLAFLLFSLILLFKQERSNLRGRRILVKK